MSPKFGPALRGPSSSIIMGGFNYSVHTDPKIPHGVFYLFGSDDKGIRFDANTGEYVEAERDALGRIIDR